MLTSQSATRDERKGSWMILVAVVVVLGTYALIPSYRPELVSSPDYYPSLARAFLGGRLDVGREVACARLAALPDPYDPKANRLIREEAAIHDLSFYRGRLYMYFGPTPALLVYAPWRLLAGSDLNPYAAGLLFAGVGFLANAWLVLSLLQAASPGLPAFVRAGLVVVLGFATWVPYVLSRHEVYEVAILCAYALTSLSLAALWRYVREGGMGWLAGSAVLLGLAIGARPNLLFLGCALLLGVYLREARAADAERWRRFSGALGVAAAGVAPWIALLLWYNYARFGHPLEFGVQYQLSGARINGLSLFTLQAVPFNLSAYFFGVPRLADHFPFVFPRGIDPVEFAPGRIFTYRVERVAGLVFLSPIGLWGLLAWVRCARSGGLPGPVRRMLAICGVAFVTALGVHLVMAAAAMRYVVDFAPWAMIPALVGAGVLWPTRRFARWSAGIAGAATVLGVSLFSAQFLVVNHPGAFYRLAKTASVPVAWAEGALGRTHGALEVELRPSAQPAGKVELLIGTAGVFYMSRADRHEYFAIEYLGEKRARFLFVQEDIGGPAVWRSEPVDFSADRARRVVMSFGALFPYGPHPRWDERRLHEVVNRIRLAVDGRTLIAAPYERMEAFCSHPEFGRVPGDLNLPAFSGKVLSLRRVSPP